MVKEKLKYQVHSEHSQALKIWQERIKNRRRTK